MPYHDGSATGLCFDNNLLGVEYKKGGRLYSPSLVNILNEIAADVWTHSVDDGSSSQLGHLPKQGVLLLNTALTVLPKQAGSHTELWKPFTELVIKALNSRDNLVWILWGNHAKSFKQYITNPSHTFIEGGHPSPLNTSKTSPFKGGKYFSKCNEVLKSKGLKEILW